MTTANPAIVGTYNQLLTTGTPGVRIPFVSLIDASQNYVFILKTLLLANGCSVVWSASGGTGPSSSGDHTDRITSAATWTPRNTVAAGSQAWVVMLDGNGGQLLICFQGATDDIVRISYSPLAAYALAGTTNNQPTSPGDELLITSATTVVGATASQDRIVHGLCSTNGKSYRFTVMRASAFVGQSWMVDIFTPLVVAPATVPLAVIVGAFTPAQLTTGNFNQAYTASTVGFLCRTVISSVQRLTQCSAQSLSAPGPVNITSSSAGSTKAELQGGTGFLPWPLWLISTFASSQGLLGQMIDSWNAGPTSFANGSGLGDQWWIQVGVWLWPNPSNVAWTLT